MTFRRSEGVTRRPGSSGQRLGGCAAAGAFARRVLALLDGLPSAELGLARPHRTRPTRIMPTTAGAAGPSALRRPTCWRSVSSGGLLSLAYGGVRSGPAQRGKRPKARDLSTRAGLSRDPFGTLALLQSSARSRGSPSSSSSPIEALWDSCTVGRLSRRPPRAALSSPGLRGLRPRRALPCAGVRQAAA